MTGCTEDGRVSKIVWGVFTMTPRHAESEHKLKRKRKSYHYKLFILKYLIVIGNDPVFSAQAIRVRVFGHFFDEL